MTTLNAFMAIRFRPITDPTTEWSFYTEVSGRPLIFVSQQEAWAKAKALTEQFPGFEYTPNVLTSSMSLAELDVLSARANAADRLADNERILRAQLDTARASLDAEKDRHQADITRIGERLIEEANDRGWCRDYDSIVDDLNRNLHVELPVRMSDYDITYTITVTVTHTCEGRDGDDAYQRDPSPSESDIIEQVRSGNWDTQDWTVEASDG
jgi:hypothetical protein